MLKQLMLKQFMPALLAGVLLIPGCSRPAPGPAPSDVAPNAASNTSTSTEETVTKTDTETLAEIPANAQKVTIELPEGYKKDAAIVQAGTPIALTFHLKKDADCGNTVVVPAAKWQKKLKVGQSATVVYTPTQTGDLKFACNMDMYHGNLIVK